MKGVAGTCCQSIGQVVVESMRSLEEAYAAMPDRQLVVDYDMLRHVSLQRYSQKFGISLCSSADR